MVMFLANICIRIQTGLWPQSVACNLPPSVMLRSLLDQQNVVFSMWGGSEKRSSLTVKRYSVYLSRFQVSKPLLVCSNWGWLRCPPLISPFKCSELFFFFSSFVGAGGTQIKWEKWPQVSSTKYPLNCTCLCQRSYYRRYARMRSVFPPIKLARVLKMATPEHRRQRFSFFL